MRMLVVCYLCAAFGYVVAMSAAKPPNIPWRSGWRYAVAASLLWPVFGVLLTIRIFGKNPLPYYRFSTRLARFWGVE